MKKIISKVIAVVLSAGMAICTVTADVNAATKESVKVPAKFKKAKELELGELIESKSQGKYYFDLEESSRVDIYTDNAPQVSLYDQMGDYIASLDTRIVQDFNNISNSIYDRTNKYYLKAGRYYVYMRYHSSDGRSGDPRLKDPDSICVDVESSNESFVEDFENDDDSAESANKIELGKTYYGQLGVKDSVDVFKFTVTNDEGITVYYKSTIKHAGYNIIDAKSLAKVAENLDEDVKKAAEGIADISGASESGSALLLELGRASRFIDDGQSSLTQKEKLKKGDYYFVVSGDALSGTAVEDHSGSYEFKLIGTADKKNTSKKK